MTKITMSKSRIYDSKEENINPDAQAHKKVNEYIETHSPEKQEPEKEPEYNITENIEELHTLVEVEHLIQNKGQKVHEDKNESTQIDIMENKDINDYSVKDNKDQIKQPNPTSTRQQSRIVYSGYVYVGTYYEFLIILILVIASVLAAVLYLIYVIIMNEEYSYQHSKKMLYHM